MVNNSLQYSTDKNSNMEIRCATLTREVFPSNFKVNNDIQKKEENKKEYLNVKKSTDLLLRCWFCDKRSCGDAVD